MYKRQEIRVELWLSRSNQEENSFLFEQLSKQREKIDAAFCDNLEWLPLENKKSCRIQYTKPADGFNRELWGDWVQWHLTHMTKLEKALKTPLQKASEALKLNKN